MIGSAEHPIYKIKKWSVIACGRDKNDVQLQTMIFTIII